MESSVIAQQDGEYIDGCRRCGILPNADILVFFRLSTMTELTIFPTKSSNGGGKFGDLDMIPFCEYLLSRASSPRVIEVLQRITKLDFSRCRIAHAGTLVLSHALTSTPNSITSLDLSHQRIGVPGVKAVMDVVRQKQTLEELRVNHCFFRDAGGAVVAELLEDVAQPHSLVFLDLSNNHLSHLMCVRIEAACSLLGKHRAGNQQHLLSCDTKQNDSAGPSSLGFRASSSSSSAGARLLEGSAPSATTLQRPPPPPTSEPPASVSEGLEMIDGLLSKQRMRFKQPACPCCTTITIEMAGNRVLDEVLNAVSHGGGMMLCMVGTFWLRRAAAGQAWRTQWACGVYAATLCILYTASTLYHSFFAIGSAKALFHIFDHCGIYLLIAGSYTPYLTILFPDKPGWSVNLLAFLWLVALLGMFITAALPSKQKYIEVWLYLGMGWASLLCLPDIIRLLPQNGVVLLVLGGVLYTGGIPFFVKNGHSLNVPDHTIWHMFVLLASLCHYFSILLYVVGFDTDDPGRQECSAAHHLPCGP